MTLPAALKRVPLPIIGAPLFIVSNPKLVIAQCTAGVVGSMPALNARPAEQLDEWLAEITETLAAGTDPAFMKAKIATARFFADHILVRCGAWRDSIVDGADAVTALALEAF